MKLIPLDFAVIAYGAAGTVLTFSGAPKGVLVFLGILSALIAVPSIFALIARPLVKYPTERRVHLLYVISNVVPIIAMMHLVNPIAICRLRFDVDQR
ncbi:MAG TPA: hypothetical protein VGA73_19225 [Candidatus Binatia bacterium]